LALFKGTRRKLAWLTARADCITVGNDFLAERLSRDANAVMVIPSLVDVERVDVRAHDATDAVILGWIGSRTTARYLEGLAPVLASLSRTLRHRTVELHAVGGGMRPIPGVRVTARQWSEHAEREALARMDIGLMPLPDDPWTRGKCAYKALQYMAAGVPVVADDVGITARVLGDGRAGITVRDPAGWVEALVALSADPSLRTALGAEGRRRVEAGYSTSRWAPVLAAVISGNSVVREPYD